MNNNNNCMFTGVLRKWQIWLGAFADYANLNKSKFSPWGHFQHTGGGCVLFPLTPNSCRSHYWYEHSFWWGLENHQCLLLCLAPFPPCFFPLLDHGLGCANTSLCGAVSLTKSGSSSEVNKQIYILEKKGVGETPSPSKEKCWEQIQAALAERNVCQAKNLA